jgi:hypothetical protein
MSILRLSSGKFLVIDILPLTPDLKTDSKEGHYPFAATLEHADGLHWQHQCTHIHPKGKEGHYPPATTS